MSDELRALAHDLVAGAMAHDAEAGATDYENTCLLLRMMIHAITTKDDTARFEQFVAHLQRTLDTLES